jgi:hypothetical protein
MHELALALGGTVGEIRGRMTYAELLSWMEYRERYGPLNPMLRNDAAIARMASAMTGAKMEAFMPWPRQRAAEPSFDELVNKIRGVAAHNNARKK